MLNRHSSRICWFLKYFYISYQMPWTLPRVGRLYTGASWRGRRWKCRIRSILPANLGNQATEIFFWKKEKNMTWNNQFNVRTLPLKSFGFEMLRGTKAKGLKLMCSLKKEHAFLFWKQKWKWKVNLTVPSRRSFEQRLL